MPKRSESKATTKRKARHSLCFYKMKLVRDEGFGTCQEDSPGLVGNLLTQCAGPPISDSQVFYRLVRDAFQGLDREHFVIVGLNAKHQIIGGSVVAIGSLTTAIVHPREIFKTAITMNAAAIILLHNHPGGDPTPSPEDHALTKRLTDCGELLGVRVLDHLILGNDRYYSFADQGVLS